MWTLHHTYTIDVRLKNSTKDVRTSKQMYSIKMARRLKYGEKGAMGKGQEVKWAGTMRYGSATSWHVPFFLLHPSVRLD